MPLHYAQLMRLTQLLYLALLPFACVASFGYFVCLFAFCVNTIYCSLDCVAADMETPFGDSALDADLSKIIRRIDKHTAAQLGSAFGRIENNFDLHPETRSTGLDGAASPSTKGRPQDSNLYDYYASRWRLDHERPC